MSWFGSCIKFGSLVYKIPFYLGFGLDMFQ